MENWPNLFIVGTAKAGTTSLNEYLKNIPGIYMSPIKEPNYFSINTVPDNDNVLKPIRNKKKYLNLFNKVTNEKIIGEASPLYLIDSKAPYLIQNVSPHAKIIISLRDPIERLFSHYLMQFRQGRFSSTLYDQIQRELKNEGDYFQNRLLLNFSLYSENVQRYMDVFGKKQIKIIIFEELILNVRETMEEILRFFDLPVNLDDFKEEVYNPYGLSRGLTAQFILRSNLTKKISNRIFSQSTKNFLKEKFLLKKQPKLEMEQQDREFLKKFFREDVEKLHHILGQKLPWPNF